MSGVCVRSVVPLGIGQEFLLDLVSQEVLEAIPVHLATDKANLPKIAHAVKDRLKRAFWVDEDKLSVGTDYAQDDEGCVYVAIVAGNLYTYLLLNGLIVPDLPPRATKYRVPGGTYSYSRRGGGNFQYDDDRGPDNA